MAKNTKKSEKASGQKNSASKKAKSATQKAKIAPEGSISFIGDSYQELKKVHPPTKDETIRMTIVVLVALALFATFLGLADFVVGKIMEQVLT